jgi:hypothetical protein
MTGEQELASVSRIQLAYVLKKRRALPNSNLGESRPPAHSWAISLKTSKGETMKKQYFTVLLALSGFFGLGAGAQAQERGRVVAKIPHEFVAGGKTLPAGTYTVTRISSYKERPMEIRNIENPQDRALLEPIYSDAAVDHAAVSLKRVGDTYYLLRVATSGGTYNLRVPKTANTLARVKQGDAMSAAGAQ